MESDEFEKELAQERRARLAAERLLEQKQSELRAANRQLSEHAMALSGQIIDQRKVVSNLQGENSRYSEDLERANTRVVAAERLLWAALENIPDGFALFGPDFRLIAANRPYLAVFEDTGGIEVGDSYQAILDICLDDGLVDLQGEEEDQWYDHMLDRWDQSTITPITLRFWNGMYVKMIDRRTSDGGIVSLALNITDSIHREEELKEACDRAQAADRAKSAFLAKMSHELRTPMNGVVGMADLLLERGLDEEAQLYSETIRSSGQALLEIINNILDFSKIEAEKLELKREPFDLERLVHDVAVIMGPALHGKPIEFHIDYDQFLPTEFIGDAGRLRQIIINLVGNAIKFTDEGDILLRIVGMPDQAGPNCQLHFTVEDSGIGIPDGMVDHIFGEFNQIEDEANRQYEGTGLGLAITRKLVEVMGGELWVDSLSGHGSCFGFKVTLPKTSTADMQNAALPAGLTHALAWVENELDKSVIGRQLQLLELETWFVASATEFDLAMKRRQPDLVLATQSRREAAGELLGKQPSDIPLLTIAERASDLSDIAKPFTRDALLKMLCGLPISPCVKRTEPLRVLAAEDNKTNQLVLIKMLEGLNIDLHMVDDGAKAVEHFKQNGADLIFLDISMPKMDGMEAARLIRAVEHQKGYVPIVAMTAHALDGDEDRIRAAGIDHYMAKPLQKAVLRRHVETVAGIRPSETSG